MRRWLRVGGIILAMFAAGYGAVAALSAVRNAARDFRYTEHVVWDEAELNAILNTSLQFENNTDEQMIVSDFQTTCGCILIGEKTGRNTTTLALLPHSKQILGVSFTNRGIPGEGLRHVVSFSVDTYPGKEFHTDLLIRNVIGTTETSPAAVVISDAVQGETREFVMEVRDKSTEMRELVDYDFRIPGLDITRIEHVRAQVPSDVDEKRKSRVIAKVHFVYHPQQVGDCKGEIGFRIGGVKHIVEFAAHVAGLVSATPSLIVLPRATGQGDDYSTRIVFRSKPDTRLKLLELTFPPGFSYTEEKSPGTTDEIVALVSYRRPDGGDQKYPVREIAKVKVKIGERICETDVPIRILR